MSQEQLKEFAQDPNLTTAELLAVKKFMIATGADKKYPNVKAMKELEESVDGKLVETKVEVTTDSYADLVRQAADADKRSNR